MSVRGEDEEDGKEVGGGSERRKVGAQATRRMNKTNKTNSYRRANFAVEANERRLAEGRLCLTHRILTSLLSSQTTSPTPTPKSSNTSSEKTPARQTASNTPLISALPTTHLCRCKQKRR